MALGRVLHRTTVIETGPCRGIAKRALLIGLPVLLQACALWPYEYGGADYYVHGSYYGDHHHSTHAYHHAGEHADRYSYALHDHMPRHGYASGHDHDRESARFHDGHEDGRKARDHGRRDESDGHARSDHGSYDHKDARPGKNRRSHSFAAPADDNEKRSHRPGHRKAKPADGNRPQGDPAAVRSAKSSPVRVDDSEWTTVQTPTGSVRIPSVIQGRDWTKASKPRKKASAAPARKHMPAYTKAPYKGSAGTSLGTGGKKRSSSADAVKPRKAARRSSKARGKANSSPSKAVDTSKWTTVQTPTGSVRVPSVIQGRDWTKASKQSRKPVSHSKSKAKPSRSYYGAKSGVSRIRR